MFKKFKNVEEIFPDVCPYFSWEAHKIDEGETKTPDYKIDTANGSFITEVKQIETKGFRFGECFSFTLGNKARSAIGRAKKQLQGHDMPTLLTLYDFHRMGHSSYESIIAAMYGQMTINVSKNTGETGKMFHGKNAKIRCDANTSISAIADLYFAKEGEEIKPCLTIYHNMYSKVPFPEGFFNEEKLITEFFFYEEEVAA